MIARTSQLTIFFRASPEVSFLFFFFRFRLFQTGLGGYYRTHLIIQQKDRGPMWINFDSRRGKRNIGFFSLWLRPSWARATTRAIWGPWCHRTAITSSVGWRSWSSHLSNTQKVPGSSPGPIMRISFLLSTSPCQLRLAWHFSVPFWLLALSLVAAQN